MGPGQETSRANINGEHNVNQQSPDNPSRRTALGWLVAGGACLVGGLSAILAGGFLFPVPRRKRPARFVCLRDEVSPGRTIPLTDTSGRSVLLMVRSDGGLTAISSVCTHLGCSVIYRPDRDEFDCPCHQGVFDGEGTPLSGPPQRPLERYPVEVRDGMVFVQL